MEEIAIDLDWFVELMEEILREKRGKYGSLEDAREGDLFLGLLKQVVKLAKQKLFSVEDIDVEEQFRILAHIANYAYLMANERRNKEYETSQKQDQDLRQEIERSLR